MVYVDLNFDYIKKLIRKWKLAFRQHKKTNNIHNWNKYKTLRNKVICELRKSKQSCHDNLDKLLSSADCNLKTFWKTSRQILNVGRDSTSIQTLHHNSIYAESDLDKAKMFNKYFSSQSVVDRTNTQLPPIPHTDYSLEFNYYNLGCQRCISTSWFNKSMRSRLI